jgi:hypothetical protein
MTIKDIENIAENLPSRTDLYLEVEAPEGNELLYFKGGNTLIKFVKQNFNENLVHKENSKKKIKGVKIWRR